MINVLFVSDADSRYGASKSLFQLVRELLLNYGNDISITVVLSIASRKMQKPLEDIGCKTVISLFAPFLQGIPYDKYKLPIKYVVRLAEYVWGSCFEAKRLDRIIDFQSIDIIHANSSREDFSALLSREYGIPLIWHIREFGDIDYKCYSYRKNYIELMNNTATIMISVSNAVRCHWINKGINPRLIRTIYNGVEKIANDKVARHKLSGEKVCIVIVGSLSKEKGQEELIQAIHMLDKKYRDIVHVDIIGGGPVSYVNKLKKTIREMGLSKIVSICGYVNDVQNRLSEYEIGFTCSKAEAFGRTTAEYMMAGLAVIASDSGANPELVRTGIDGELYQYGDIVDLRDKVAKLVTNPELIMQYGANAKKRAEELFSSSVNAKSIYNLYRKLME